MITQPFDISKKPLSLYDKNAYWVDCKNVKLHRKLVQKYTTQKNCNGLMIGFKNLYIEMKVHSFYTIENMYMLNQMRNTTLNNIVKRGNYEIYFSTER